MLYLLIYLVIRYKLSLTALDSVCGGGGQGGGRGEGQKGFDVGDNLYANMLSSFLILGATIYFRISFPPRWVTLM